MSEAIETPLTFDCAGDSLVGILHRPALPRKLAVVLVVGAPQYRVGSHRQFVLLARDLAAAGYAVLRFDYRGMGDSDGRFVGFESVEDDIRAAIDALCGTLPETQGIALWGLCDGATAIAFYAAKDPRVAAAVLLNPWVRSDISVAQGRLSQHYSGRLLSRDFWLRLAKGEVSIVRSALDFSKTLCTALIGRFAPAHPQQDDGTAPLPLRVGNGLLAFQGHVLLILSGQDLTAHEFDRAVLHDKRMKSWTVRPGVTIDRLPTANHTYARLDWRGQVHDWTLAFLRSEEARISR